ncbi:MAG: inositol monophosphatase family protein, partial [Aquiluna sp.]
MTKDLEFALELAQSADEISLSRFRALDLKVETKPDRTPVTDADKAVEERLRAMIADFSPADAVIGEEFGSAAGSREWIIDPIDGTANFLRGLPIWATLIALRVDGELKLSVVSAPALGRMWWAERGAGAHTKDIDGSKRSLKVSKVTSLEDSYVSFNSIS